jgi:hypothetical protein
MNEITALIAIYKVRHSDADQFNFIDLIGFTKESALKMTELKIAEAQAALSSRRI